MTGDAARGDSWNLHGLLDSLPEGPAADAVAAVLDRVVGSESSEDDAPASEELLAGSCAPFTDTIWYLDAPFDDVAAAAEAWLTELGGRSFTSLDGPLPTLLHALEPFAIPSWKQLLVPTRSNWTALFSQGSDLGTHMVIGRRLGCRSLRTNVSPHIVRDGSVVAFGDRAFWLSEPDGSSRNIQASFQSRWQWHVSGSPLPFEDLNAYAAKRIPDRFDLSRLNSYCRELGIRRNEPEFYLPHGLLIEEDTTGWSGRPRMIPSDQWRASNR
ncbi:hypothetical protein GE115_03840 [Agromyces sp. CFH 90414]|uniref:Uncharacterized protein n=1 Tax=Agromyces agglutinans TaxID=2662258 RepID=A0A6I2F370_9MICO|nr:hypothetical protein [Agromyces agglutinans]MRG59002.1 hypothetical protein [Agromyces agglutinans]